MTKHHGMTALSGMSAYCKRTHQTTREDRFGRMFPDLAPAFSPADLLAAIGGIDGPMSSRARDRAQTVAIGQVIFGQFIDHDITLDVSSSFNRVNEAGEIGNVRTPTLDLDCIYGSGPEPHPYLYSQTAPFAGVKLLTGADEPGADQVRQNDLLRAPNNRAIIGDPRNDENRLISQMQLAIIKFHNNIAQALHDDPDNDHEGAELFEEARRIVTWHYQWAVVNNFLVDMCGGAVVKDILACGRQFYCPQEPFIPVEFAVAAYRFGHSMIPMRVQVQGTGTVQPFFGDVLGRGFEPLGSTDAICDWRELFFVGNRSDVQRAEELDTTMAEILLDLPFVGAGDVSSLATRNLLRGNSFLLPGGDKVAEAMGRSETEIAQVMAKITQISTDAIATAGISADPIIEGAPLWLYILAEAEVIGRQTTPGNFDPTEGLGPVGARIVAEVLIGLLEMDEHSFLGADRNWIPDTDLDTIGKILVSTNASIF